MLLAALSYAGAGITPSAISAAFQQSTLALGQQLGALCWLAIPASLQWPATMPSSSAVGALTALSVLSTALAFILYFRLIACIGPTMTSTVTYIAPAFGLLGGAVFLGERLTAGTLAGFVIIALSVLLVTRSSVHNPPVVSSRHQPTNRQRVRIGSTTLAPGPFLKARGIRRKIRREA